MSKTVSFEDKVKKLESIIEKMESGDLPLEESLKIYEKGMGLAKDCEGILKNARLKMEKITKEMNDDA